MITRRAQRLLVYASGLAVIVAGFGADASATPPGANGQIAFRRYLDPARTTGALFTANPDGTKLNRVTRPARGVVDQEPDWSSDGRKLAFERREPCPPDGPRNGLDGTCDLVYIVNRDGSGLRRFVACGFDADAPFPGNCVGARHPSWSPDGSKLAFRYSLVDPAYAGSLGVNGGIWIVNADGTGLRQVTQRTPGTSWDFGPQWSPDGSKLVFFRADLAREADAVFTVNVDGTGEFQVTSWELGAGDGPDWSPDGHWLLFRGQPADGSSNVYKAHPDGTGLTNLTQQGPSGFQYLSSSFSPDGRQIVTARTPGTGGAADVYTMRADGSNLQPVTRTALWESSADWGPAEALGPGARLGRMTLTRAASTQADAKLFDACDPVILQAGSYRRSCSVSKVRRLFVGYGAFDADPAALNADWDASSWEAWLDGRPLALRAFGTLDRILPAFPAAGGKDATLREWRVTVLNPTRGRHTVRYRTRGPLSGSAGGTIDATFAFTVRG